MPQIRTEWNSAKAQLHADLIERGWLEAHGDSRRTPLYGLGIVGILISVAGFVIAVIAQEGWAVLGSLALLFGAIASIAFAHSLSELTAEGESVVGPWRGYASVIQTGYPQLSHDELDMALPYAVAMGYRDEIGRALEATGESGNAYSPSWFRSSATQSGGSRRYGPGILPLLDRLAQRHVSPALLNRFRLQRRIRWRLQRRWRGWRRWWRRRAAASRRRAIDFGGGGCYACIRA